MADDDDDYENDEAYEKQRLPDSLSVSQDEPMQGTASPLARGRPTAEVEAGCAG